MFRGQLNLAEMSLGKNRRFVKSLYYGLDLEEKTTSFNKAEDATKEPTPVIDEYMTLDLYLALMNKNFKVELQLGTKLPREIKLGLYGKDPMGTDRIVFIEMPYSLVNYDLVKDTFQRIYNKDFEQVENRYATKDITP